MVETRVAMELGGAGHIAPQSAMPVTQFRPRATARFAPVGSLRSASASSIDTTESDLRSTVLAMDEAATARAAAAAALGLRTDLDGAAQGELAQLVTADPDPGVRATALAALVRAARVAAPPAWRAAAADDDATVRRRAAETAPALGDALTLDDLVALLHDTDAWVAEAAAFALGERGDRDAVPALAPAATEHDDPLVRESRGRRARRDR